MIHQKHARDPPEHRRRNHGDAVEQHLLPVCPAGVEHDLPPELLADEEHQRAEHVREDDREHIARDAHVQHREEEDVQHDHEQGVDHALHCEERRLALGADELRAERVVAGGHDVEADQPEEGVQLGNKAEQRQNAEQQQPAERDRIKPDGEDAPAVLDVVDREAEHAVRDAHGNHAQQQVRALRDQICRAVVSGGEISGIKPHHEEHQQLRAEGAEADEHGVRQEGLVFVLTHRKTVRFGLIRIQNSSYHKRMHIVNSVELGVWSVELRCRLAPTGLKLRVIRE